MNLVAFTVGGFPDEFVEMGVVHEPAEPFATCLIVGEMKVGCTSAQMVAILDSSYGCIELGASESGTDDDRDIEMLS